MPSSSCSCSPPFPLLSFPFAPPSLASPFLALPLPLSFLWIASLLILIAYALPCLSYFPPSSHTCSFHIFGGEVLDLAFWLSLNTQHRAGHVRHLSGGKRSSKWQKGGVEAGEGPVSLKVPYKEMEEGQGREGCRTLRSPVSLKKKTK